MNIFPAGTASQKVIYSIETEIINGRIGKGDKLPTERRLAEDMGVSRATVREALKTLESMGIVESIQGSGNYITSTPEQSLDRSLCTLFALSNGTLDNLMQLRILLEAEATKDIVQFATDEEIDTLASAADYDYFDGSIKNQARLDRNFHFAIVEQSRNPLIKYLYNTLAALFDVYRKHVFEATLQRDDNKVTRRDHLAIVDALRERDAAAAERALRTHLMSDDSREILDRTFKTI